MQAGQEEFGDEHVNFGNFSDMVSRHSDEQSYFHIGLVRQRTEGRSGEVVVSSLYTFVENKGRPRLSSLTFCRGSQKLSLRFRGDHIWFKSHTYPTAPTIQDIVSTSLVEWKREHSSRNGAYEKLDTAGFPGRLPLLFVLGVIGSGLGGAASRKNQTKQEITFQTPDVVVGEDIVWLAPIRTKAQRTYDQLTTVFSPEGDHTPYLIRKTLRSKNAAGKFKEFIRKVGESSGLFQDVLIKNYGREITAPFELDIVLDDKALNLSTVGYGVSQSLPVLVEVLDRPRGTWFAIQQPEVHLHPLRKPLRRCIF